MENGNGATKHAQLTVVDLGDGRAQVIDGRGHYLAGFGDAKQAEAFLAGYVAGRQDAAAIVAAVSQALAEVSAR